MAETDGLGEIIRYEPRQADHIELLREREFRMRLLGLLSDTSTAFHVEDTIAEAVGFSVRQYRRICWKVFGEPAHSFARRIRLEIAAGQLATQRIGLSTAALSAGYSSTDAFVRAFREQFGSRPSTFSKLNADSSRQLPGFLNSQGIQCIGPAQIRIAVTPETADTYLYDGPILLARLDGCCRIDWCPWRPRRRWVASERST